MPLLTQGIMVGSNQAIVVVPFIIAYIFNHVIYNKNRIWWNKYNFILSCALNSGVAIGSLIILFWRNVGATGELPPNPLNPATNRDYYCREASYFV